MLRRVVPWLGVVALVVAAVVTAGWGDSPSSDRSDRSDRQPSRQQTSFPSASALGTPVADPTSMSFVEAHSLTRNAALKRSDLPSDFRRATSREGYRLTFPSLDLCGGSFESEKYRLAANRVTFRSGDARVQNVVVVYERGHADQALAELEAAAPRCTRPVRPSAREQPDTLALRVRRTGPIRTVRRDLVVERRGEALSLLQVDGRQGYLTLDLARALGNRLEAQLP